MDEADRNRPTIKPRAANERAAREARVAEEMRANLLKRKAQRAALGRTAPAEPAPDDD